MTPSYRLGRLPLRHHVPLRLPDVALDARGSRPPRRRGQVALLQPRGDQPAGGKEAPLGTGVVLRVVDDAHRRPPAAKGHGSPRPLVPGRRPRPARRGTQAPPTRSRGSSSRRWVSTRASWRQPSPTRPPATRCSPSTSGSSNGAASACPTLVFADDQALFGPVLIDPPTGEAAVRLWELVTRLARVPPPVRAAATQGSGRRRRHRRGLHARTSTPGTGSPSNARRPEPTPTPPVDVAPARATRLVRADPPLRAPGAGIRSTT